MILFFPLVAFSSVNLVTREMNYFDVNGGKQRPGESFTYIVELKNGGTESTNADFTIDFPKFLYLQSVDSFPSTSIDLSDNTGGTNSTGKIVISGIILDSNISVFIHFTARVASAAEFYDNGIDNATKIKIKLRGFVSGSAFTEPVGTLDHTQLTDQYEYTRFELFAQAQIAQFYKEITFPLNRSFVSPGETIIFNLHYVNIGDAVASDIRIEDALHTYLTHPKPSNGGEFNNLIMKWKNLSDLPPLGKTGNNSFVTLEATISNIQGIDETITNQARIYYVRGSKNENGIATDDEVNLFSDDPTLPGLIDPTLITIKPNQAYFHQSTVSIIDINSGDLEPGDQVQCNISVINTGSAPGESVEVTAQFDDNILSVTNPQIGQFGYMSGSNTIIWDSVSVASFFSYGAENLETLSFTGTIKQNVNHLSEIFSTFLIKADLIDSIEIITPALKISAIPDFSLSEISYFSVTNPIEPGFFIAMNLRIKNTGKGVGRNVSVNAELNSLFESIIPGQNGMVVNSTVTWTPVLYNGVSAIAQNSFADLAINAKIASDTLAGTYSILTATVSSSNPSKNFSIEPNFITIERIPKLGLFSKEVKLSEDGATIGSIIEYILQIQNIGTGDYHHVTITDTLDTNALTGITASKGSVLSNGLVTISSSTALELAVVLGDPAKTIQFTITATIKTGLADGYEVVNQAELTSDEIIIPISSDSNLNTVSAEATTFKVIVPKVIEDGGVEDDNDTVDDDTVFVIEDNDDTIVSDEDSVVHIDDKTNVDDHDASIDDDISVSEDDKRPITIDFDDNRAASKPKINPKDKGCGCEENRDKGNLKTNLWMIVLIIITSIWIKLKSIRVRK